MKKKTSVQTSVKRVFVEMLAYIHFTPSHTEFFRNKIHSNTAVEQELD